MEEVEKDDEEELGTRTELELTQDEEKRRRNRSRKRTTAIHIDEALQVDWSIANPPLYLVRSVFPARL